jgi:transposase InsO family protein
LLSRSDRLTNRFPTQEPVTSSLSIRYSERLAEVGAVASVGSTGDSYDNALAEAFNSLFKAELVRNKGPGRTSTTSS